MEYIIIYILVYINFYFLYKKYDFLRSLSEPRKLIILIVYSLVALFAFIYGKLHFQENQIFYMLLDFLLSFLMVFSWYKFPDMKITR